ncbi:MAG: hypothetical protein PQJ61_13455 [Spirochaetales bacterium]|uniref:Pyruvate carboxyltransferase domain-containing protein n=1 Tax=Candidatus Thalassospirochaeta sargassi TaxID=3119039 RepID=A0AAJ1MNH7_9SPIO|nr:hypothetical protein [Spirochaetales bacterium]
MKKIIDTTLRDGEQAPGVVFTAEQRMYIAELLAASGVDEIEAGSPAMGEEDIEFLRWCAGLGLPVFSWCRADDKDIEAAKRTGLPGIHISLPVSDRLLKVFGKTRGWVEQKMLECCNSCFTDFDSVSIGFMDASRTDTDYLKYLTKLAGLLGFDRVRIADTAGIMYPADVIKLMKELCTLDVDLEFHPHNDLGMATANGLTALDAGADALSVTVLGIGERAGNARFEEVAFAKKLRDNKSGLDLAVISELGKYISGITGRVLDPDKAVIGENVFSHETGIHAAATIRDPLAFMPGQPEKYGLGDTKIFTGRHSGSKSIQYNLSKLSLDVDRETAVGMLPMVRARSVKNGRGLKPRELELLYYEYISRNGIAGAVRAV